MYPLLWLKGFVSIFYWDPKESPKMLASVEDLVQEEKGQSETEHIKASGSRYWRKWHTPVKQTEPRFI